MSLDDTTTAVAEAPNTGTMVPGEAAPQVEAPATETTPRNDDTEAQARAMGWVPKDEFRGPPEKWRDAAEFVKVGEEALPVVRERLRDTTRKLSELERKLNERDQTYAQNLTALERMTTVALNRQREQIESSYAAAQRAAVESGDVQRWEQLRRDEATALSQHDRQAYEAARPVPQQQRQPAPGPAPHEAPIVDSWVKQNPWFMRDAEMNEAAQQIHVALRRERPDLPLEQNLAEVQKRIHGRFADRLGITPVAPRQPASVEGGGRMPVNSVSRGRGASDLPADARAQAEKFIKQGLFKDINEYAKDYFAQ